MRRTFELTPALLPDVHRFTLPRNVALGRVLTLTLCLSLGDTEKIAAHNEIKLDKHRQCNKPEQRGARLLGPASEMSWTCGTCVCNAHNALCNRHLTKQPVVTRSLRRTSKLLSLIAPLVRTKYLEMRELHSAAVHLSRWPEKKRNDILESIDSQDGVHAGYVKCFVKFEGGHKAPSKARGIQMYKTLATQNRRAARFYCLQKAFSKVLEDESLVPNIIRQHFGRRIDLTFASGMTPVQLGKWMSNAVDRNPRHRFYERDGKNWDSTMSSPHINQRLKFYELIDRDLASFARECVNVKGSMRAGQAKLNYRVKGTTKSGHNDTSLGNSITNLMLATETLLEHNADGSIIAMGDDLLMAVDGDFDLDSFVNFERGMGIIPEANKFKEPEETSFVSGTFFKNVDSYVFVPIPGRTFARLFWTTKNVGKKKERVWRNTVCAGVSCLFGRVEVMEDFLDVARSGVGTDTSVLTRDQYRRHRIALEQADAVYSNSAFEHWFITRYGITGEDLNGLKTYFRGLPRGTAVFMRHDLLDHVMAVDFAEIDRRAWWNHT